jgi:chromosome segregation ATPase
MPTENIKENAVRKVIQELVVPDLQKLIGKIDILEERISSVKNELKSDIARIDERINSLDGKIDSLDEKIEINYKRLDEKIGSIDNKMDTKITALSEKVDYMNKTNERLFDIIIHSSDTKKIAG